jgi:hypothetical protein
MVINNYQVFVRQFLPQAKKLRQNIESQERANLHTTSYMLYNPRRHGLRVEAGCGGEGRGRCLSVANGGAVWFVCH